MARHKDDRNISLDEVRLCVGHFSGEKYAKNTINFLLEIIEEKEARIAEQETLLGLCDIAMQLIIPRAK